MSFTSFAFLFFLILVFGLYWSIPSRRGQNLLLLAASYAFYAWWDWRFCSLILFSSLVDFGVGLALEQTRGPRARRWLLGLSLSVNLGLLGFFKYCNFFADSLQVLLGALGWQLQSLELAILLPIGISFYTFQTLSYTFDVYDGRLRATPHLIEYLAYVSFFPQLVIGPIERGTRLLPQILEPRKFDDQLARDGVRQMLWGVFQKKVIADNLALIVDQAYADPSAHSGPMLALAATCFIVQVYCDFAGYSHIAIGTAKLLGIRLMRNFAYPLFAQSFAELWGRWHISLSTWFRDYLFVRLGGFRAPLGKRSRNVMVTFLAIGLWHGASWNFVIWGAMLGLWMLPTALRLTGRRRVRARDTPGGEGFLPAPGAALRMARTFLGFALSGIFFRAETLDAALLIVRKCTLGLFSTEGYAQVVRMALDPIHGATLLHLAFFIAAEWLQRRHEHPLHAADWPAALRWALYTAILWDVLYFGTRTTQPFVYFQF